MGAYFRDNLAKGDQIGLGLMYGFNLIGGGREDLPGCVMIDGTSTHNCAMRASEIRALADTLAAIATSRAAAGKDQGCGVNGWWINVSASDDRTYYFSDEIQDALQYLNTKLASTQPGSCIE
jgi:hypothetical protein